MRGKFEFATTALQPHMQKKTFPTWYIKLKLTFYFFLETKNAIHVRKKAAISQKYF